MGTIDVIPDIHGQMGKLRTALEALGWKRRTGGWVHPEPRRSIVFLGDFIDGGPENADVIHTVRGLIDSGRARAIMGNHELNALHFHGIHPETGAPLRPRSCKKMEQHASFLHEFKPGSPATKDVLSWMQSLPLFLEEDGFRAVHACWDEAAIARLRAITGTGVLTEEQLVDAADPAHELFALVETVAKGPEHPLPEGIFFTDRNGHRRDHVRLRWWDNAADSWRTIAMSVPNPNELPTDRLPETLLARGYQPQERPVFFGHYWMKGAPILQAHNALCLDYSAGREGPLVTYELHADEARLMIERIRVHPLPG